MRQMRPGKASDQASNGGQPEIGVPARAQKCIKRQTEQQSYEVTKHQAENSDHSVNSDAQADDKRNG
jgi:hypothetical protein